VGVFVRSGGRCVPRGLFGEFKGRRVSVSVVEAVVNRRAVRKYGELVSAMTHLWVVLEEARTVIERVPDLAGRSLRVPSREELLALQRKAEQDLKGLEARSRRYQAELVSRDWRI
jgi:hypothetical protein